MLNPYDAEWNYVDNSLGLVVLVIRQEGEKRERTTSHRVLICTLFKTAQKTLNL
jgi:hypothetical protein